MPWSISYFPDGAEILFRGRTTGEEVRLAKTEFFAHRFPQSPRWVLCDFSLVSQFVVVPDDVDRMVTLDRRHLESHPGLAEVVVAPTPLEYGMSRMWESQVDGERESTRVTHTRDEAARWLRARGVAVEGLRAPLTAPDAEARGP